MLWGVTLRSPHPYAGSRSVDLTEALKTPGCSPSSPTTTCRARSTSASSTRTSPCSRSTWSATRASPSRWSPPTTPRPRARPQEDRRRVRRPRAGRRRGTGAGAGQPAAAPGRQPGPAREDPPGDPHPTADVVVSGDYEVGMQDQAFLGPESGLAVPDGTGGVDLFVATQWLHVDQRRSARRSGSGRTGSGSSSRGRRRVRRPRGPVDARARAACSRCTPASP